MTRIQNQFYAGEIGIDKAIMEQLEFLRNPENVDDIEFEKCITPFFLMLEAYEEVLAPETIAAISEADARRYRTLAAEDYITPSGKFRIVFETTGTDAVPSDDANNNDIPDYIEEMGVAADSAYRYEIEYLGYTDPIPDGQTYDIFVENLRSFGAYGLTSASTSGTFPCESLAAGTCIYVENDFVGFPANDDPDGNELGAMRVTIAHEFKHAIQFVEEGWQGDPNRWLEMDATLYEEVVYDQVNDYYNYISDFSSDLFAFPSTTLIPGSYEDITWALFFHQQYDPFFWPNVWQRIVANPDINYLDAVSDEVESLGDSYPSIFVESYMWHFASGPDFSNEDYGFDEARLYPRPSITDTISSLQNQLSADYILNRSAARFFLASLTEASDGYLQLDFTTTSSAIHFGLIGYHTNGSVETYFIEGNPEILSQSIETPLKWSNYDQIGLIVANDGIETSETFSFQFAEYSLESQIQITQNFPNPFSDLTHLQISTPIDQDITIQVYDILGRLVLTPFDGTVPEGVNNIPINASFLASGVYIVRIETETLSFTRKITLIK